MSACVKRSSSTDGAKTAQSLSLNYFSLAALAF